MICVIKEQLCEHNNWTDPLQWDHKISAICKMNLKVFYSCPYCIYAIKLLIHIVCFVVWDMK